MAADLASLLNIKTNCQPSKIGKKMSEFNTSCSKMLFVGISIFKGVDLSTFNVVLSSTVMYI